MTALPTGSDLDRAEQTIAADPTDHEAGPDTAALHPLAEPARSAFDTAALADRIEQAWLIPHDDDDYARLAT